VAGGSGIFRSGRSECYGTQPNDNEHSFAVVLSDAGVKHRVEATSGGSTPRVILSIVAVVVFLVSGRLPLSMSRLFQWC